MQKLVLATRNSHKIRELKLLLKPLSSSFDIYSLNDFSSYSPPEESGKTFEENATLKAVHAASFLKTWALADDSGLVVPALNGAPGVISARYAGEKATDRENRQKLLEAMIQLEGIERAAYFECVLVIANPDGYKKSAKGICEGTISLKEKGRNGFGYDSLFIKHDYQKTFAEIDEEVKNKISHRAKAVSKLLIQL